MYTTAKKLSIFLFILAIINMVFTALCLLELTQKGFAESFIKTCYYLTGTISLLLLTVSNRSMCSDLELDYEVKIKQNREQNKRLAELEEKIKKLQNNP